MTTLPTDSVQSRGGDYSKTTSNTNSQRSPSQQSSVPKVAKVLFGQKPTLAKGASEKFRNFHASHEYGNEVVEVGQDTFNKMWNMKPKFSGSSTLTTTSTGSSSSDDELVVQNSGSDEGISEKNWKDEFSKYLDIFVNSSIEIMEESAHEIIVTPIPSSKEDSRRLKKQAQVWVKQQQNKKMVAFWLKDKGVIVQFSVSREKIKESLLSQKITENDIFTIKKQVSKKDAKGRMIRCILDNIHLAIESQSKKELLYKFLKKVDGVKKQKLSKSKYLMLIALSVVKTNERLAKEDGRRNPVTMLFPE